MHAPKPYPTYRESGVPWLGEVPSHWDLRRTKSLLSQRSEKGFPDEPLLAATQTKGVVRKEQYENRTVLALKDLQLLKLVRVGDFVISLRSFQGGIEFAREQGIISPAYTVLYPVERDNHAFLTKLFKSQPYIENLALHVTGIRQGQNIDYERLARSRLPLPPLLEQAAIVRFLDHADRRIRRYIRAKEKLIALLQEQQQAIIHQAVTGRIDVRTGQPYPAYKPSGVEWLGDMPAHWELVRLKDVAKVQTGLTLGKDYGAAQTISRPYLRVANVQTGRLDLTHVKSIDVPPNETEKTNLLNGDVLMTEGGDIDKLGRGCIWRSEVPGCLHQNHIFAVRCEQNTLHPEFLVGLMASRHGRTYFQATAKQTTNLASTNSNTLRAFPVPLPLIEDQQSILRAISEKTSTLNNTMGQTEREIGLLREYRTRVIADVVTGKLDVREAAAALPEVDPLADDDEVGDDLGAGEALAFDGEEAPAEVMD